MGKTKKPRVLTVAQQRAADAEAQRRLADKWKNVPTFASRMPGPAPVTARATRAGLSLLVAERIAAERARPSIHSCGAVVLGTPLPQPIADQALREREATARARKHVVAPVANKMGYQLITDAEHFKTMGRKT